MAKTSIASQILNWKNLITTAQASAAEAPGLGLHIANLQEVLDGVEALTAVLDTRMGLKRQTTQERRALLEKGKDIASQARAALTAHYGRRNTRLVEFGTRPVEPRRVKAKAETAKPAPAAAENAKPEPETPAPASPAEPTK